MGTAQDNTKQNRQKPFAFVSFLLIDQIRRLLEESGLVFVEALDADTMQEVTEKSERVFCIASEHGKCGTGETK